MIALLCPSYGRPERLATMYKSAKSTASKPDEVVVWAAFELDDPHLPDYNYKLHYDMRCNSTWGFAGPAWNALARAAIERGADIVHMTADDLVFKTSGWDAKVDEHFRRHSLKVLHYRDDLRDDKMALNPFVSKEFVKRVGFVSPLLKHFYSDTWIEDIGRRAGVLCYDPNIHIQQAHWKNSLAPYDNTYARTRRGNTLAEDRYVWETTTQEREELARRLTAAA